MAGILAGPTISSQFQFFTIKQKNSSSDLLTSGKRWLREISEIKLRTCTTRPDGVVLGTLLQAIRGILLFAFNWTLFIQFDRIRSVPGLDVMIILPPSSFYLIGFLDILMVKRVWRRDLNGWRYGIAMSMLILLLIPFAYLLYLAFHILLLYIIIILFTIAEIIALVTPSARWFYRT